MERINNAVTVSVDPDMLQKIDSYIREHEGVELSQIVNESLRHWHDRIPRSSALDQQPVQWSFEQSAQTLARHAHAQHVGRWHRPRGLV